MKTLTPTCVKVIAASILFNVSDPCRSEILFDEVSQEMGLSWPEIFGDLEKPPNLR